MIIDAEYTVLENNIDKIKKPQTYFVDDIIVKEDNTIDSILAGKQNMELVPEAPILTDEYDLHVYKFITKSHPQIKKINIISKSETENSIYYELECIDNMNVSFSANATIDKQKYYDEKARLQSKEN